MARPKKSSTKKPTTQPVTKNTNPPSARGCSGGAASLWQTDVIEAQEAYLLLRASHPAPWRIDASGVLLDGWSRSFVDSDRALMDRVLCKAPELLDSTWGGLPHYRSSDPSWGSGTSMPHHSIETAYCGGAGLEPLQEEIDAAYASGKEDAMSVALGLWCDIPRSADTLIDRLESFKETLVELIEDIRTRVTDEDLLDRIAEIDSLLDREFPLSVGEKHDSDESDSSLIGYTHRLQMDHEEFKHELDTI